MKTYYGLFIGPTITDKENTGLKHVKISAENYLDALNALILHMDIVQPYYAPHNSSNIIALIEPEDNEITITLDDMKQLYNEKYPDNKMRLVVEQESENTSVEPANENIFKNTTPPEDNIEPFNVNSNN